MTTQVGLTKDAGWEIGVSRKVPHDADDVWKFLTSPAGIAIWLGRGAGIGDKGTAYRTSSGTVGEWRSVRPGDRMRLTWQPKGWDHETTLQVTVSQGGSGNGTTIRFHHDHLADSAERERQREHWQSVMDRVVAALEQKG